MSPESEAILLADSVDVTEESSLAISLRRTNITEPIQSTSEASTSARNIATESEMVENGYGHRAKTSKVMSRVPENSTERCQSDDPWSANNSTRCRRDSWGCVIVEDNKRPNNEKGGLFWRGTCDDRVEKVLREPQSGRARFSRPSGRGFVSPRGHDANRSSGRGFVSPRGRGFDSPRGQGHLSPWGRNSPRGRNDYDSSHNSNKWPRGGYKGKIKPFHRVPQSCGQQAERGFHRFSGQRPSGQLASAGRPVQKSYGDIVKDKDGHGKRTKSNKDVARMFTDQFGNFRCFRCRKIDHLIVDCPLSHEDILELKPTECVICKQPIPWGILCKTCQERFLHQ